MWPYELTSRSCWFILVSKSGDAELGEVEDNLLELKNFSITYKTDSSKLASTTSTGSAWLFLNSLRVQTCNFLRIFQFYRNIMFCS